MEDRATVGTDPSAMVVPYGTGGAPRGAACFLGAVGPNAANPRAVARFGPSSAHDERSPGTLSGEEPEKA